MKQYFKNYFSSDIHLVTDAMNDKNSHNNGDTVNTVTAFSYKCPPIFVTVMMSVEVAQYCCAHLTFGRSGCLSPLISFATEPFRQYHLTVYLNGLSIWRDIEKTFSSFLIQSLNVYPVTGRKKFISAAWINLKSFLFMSTPHYQISE